MKKIVIINRSVWVGGLLRKVGDVIEVSDNVAGEMCGALRTARPWDAAKDAPKAPPPTPTPIPLSVDAAEVVSASEDVVEEKARKPRSGK